MRAPAPDAFEPIIAQRLAIAAMDGQDLLDGSNGFQVVARRAALAGSSIRTMSFGYGDAGKRNWTEYLAAMQYRSTPSPAMDPS
jgi:hypothetical protein